mmetsp:Transcript_24323/g.69923  ORF Transcript_24323/g.69923 Transcript_24323/m.69923 type:complete len:430 (-) Transcript_24323:317-1606(-)
MKDELHQLKASTAKARRDIDRISTALDILPKQKQILTVCIASMRSSGIIEKVECAEKELLTKVSACPPMVLGRELDKCSNLGSNPNPSAMMITIIARSELELQRNGLVSLQVDKAKRRTERHRQDLARRQEEHLEDLIKTRARKVDALANAVSKQRRLAMNNEIISFFAAGDRLRKTASLTKNIDDDRLQDSRTDFDRRKLIQTDSERIPLAQRGLLVGDEHCIYDLKTPSGIQHIKLCHGTASEDRHSDLEHLSMKDRLDHERKAAYDDSIDFIGRIQGFRKKLRSLESSRCELRGHCAATVESLHEHKAVAEKDESSGNDRGRQTNQMKTSASLPSNLAIVSKQCLLNISEEIQTTRNAMRALERKHRRAQRMMLRRSVLGNNFFPRERNRTLMECRRRWIYYKEWCTKTRQYLESKCSVLIKGLST